MYLYSLSFQERKCFEKIGEPTEVALKVLAEKVNVNGEDRMAMTNQRRASACFKQAQEEYDKQFTLEFSRDRKSMSVYCLPKINRSSPVMFVKVYTCTCICMLHVHVCKGGRRRKKGSSQERMGMGRERERA